MKSWLAIPVFFSCVAAALAGQPEHLHPASEGHAAPPAVPSSYAGMQHRSIKSLSDEQLGDLRAGRGMSYALAAELNGYPGPSHTLELADRLGLDAEQGQQTRRLMAGMNAEAKVLGEQLIAAEAALDRLFREGRPGVAELVQATAAAAQAQGRLRAAHLKYHLGMMEVLTPAQVEQYKLLRGYQPSAARHSGG